MNPNDATLMFDQPLTPKNEQEPLVISNESQPEALAPATDEQPKTETVQPQSQNTQKQDLKSAGISAAAGAVGGAVAGVGVQYADDLMDKAGEAVETVEGWLGLKNDTEEPAPVTAGEPGADPNAPAEEPQNTQTTPQAQAEPQPVATNDAAPAAETAEPVEAQTVAQTEQPTNDAQQGTPLDLNNDGTVDAVAMDQNHDGIVDAVAIDQDQDGAIDAMVIDQNQDGYADSELVDSNHDGVVDGALVDTDGDHDLDTVLVDTNQDGQFTDADQAQPLEHDLTIELSAHDQPADEAVADNGAADYDNDGPVEDWA